MKHDEISGKADTGGIPCQVGDTPAEIERRGPVFVETGCSGAPRMSGVRGNLRRAPGNLPAGWPPLLSQRRSGRRCVTAIDADPPLVRRPTDSVRNLHRLLRRAPAPYSRIPDSVNARPSLSSDAVAGHPRRVVGPLRMPLGDRPFYVAREPADADPPAPGRSRVLHAPKRTRWTVRR